MLKVSKYFIPLVFLSSICQAIDCPQTAVRTVVVKSVIDGDTLRLSNNQRIRLPSINTPELANDDHPAEPLAVEAGNAVKQFLQGRPNIAISIGERQQDRYGRLLAHVFHPLKGSLEAHLVRLGLAFPIPVPPDMSHAECLVEAAEEAQRKQLGIWGENFSTGESGFRRVCGRIEKIDSAGAMWLELQGNVVIRIHRNDWSYFEKSEFNLTKAEQWQGRHLEVWGSLQDRGAQTELMQRGFKRWMVRARSPYVLRWNDHCN